jgi:hypothetical protein
MKSLRLHAGSYFERLIRSVASARRLEEFDATGCLAAFVLF